MNDAMIARAVELYSEALAGKTAAASNPSLFPSAPEKDYVRDLRRGGVRASARVRAWLPPHLLAQLPAGTSRDR
jgi:hypothetical protein